MTKMKKQTKYIIIVLVIAIILGGVLGVLLLTDPNKGTETEETDSSATESSEESSEEEEKPALVGAELADIESVTVSNENGEYTIIPEEDGDAYTYSVEGVEGIDLKTATLQTEVSLFTETTVTKEIGEVEDLDEFGLDGKTTIEAKMKDGSSIKLILGIAPGETVGRYILYDGKVYICSVNTSVYDAVESVVSPASWTIDELTDDETNYSLLRSVNLSGSAFEREIDMVYNDDLADYDLNKPVKATGSITMADTLAEVLLEFSCTSTAKIYPTDEELEEMGLKEPYASITYSLNGYTHSITVGNVNDSGRYCYVDNDSTVVYNVSESMISDWIDVNEVDFRDGYITLQSLYYVDELYVEAEGREPVTVTRTRSLKESDDETLTEETATGSDYDYVSMIDGEEIDAADMRTFYRACIGVPILSMQEMKKDGDAVISIKFHHFDPDEEDTLVEFYKVKDNSSRYVAYMNGEYSATVRSTSIEEFFESYDTFTGSDAETEDSESSDTSLEDEETEESEITEESETGADAAADSEAADETADSEQTEEPSESDETADTSEAEETIEASESDESTES